MTSTGKFIFFVRVISTMFLAVVARAQMIDNTQATSTARAGINKSLADEVGPGRGGVNTPGSSVCIISHDPFRSIRRGRQLFQRKFTRVQGQGPNEGDGIGDINTNLALGAGLADSCALCHGRPRVGGCRWKCRDSTGQPRCFPSLWPRFT